MYKRQAQYPLAFLGGKGPPSPEPVWNGTLITDQYAGYNGVLDAKVYPQRKAAACAAHARRRFEELSRGGSSASAVATEAMLRWTRIYRTEAAFAEMGCDERRHARQMLSRPLWEEFEIWLKLQRTQVPDCLLYTSCRRDTAAAAGPWRWQDEEGLRLGLGAQPPRPAPGRGLRVLPGPRGAVPAGLPGRQGAAKMCIRDRGST